MFKKFIILVVGLYVSACTATVDNNYLAQSYLKVGAGEIKIGNFEYIPAKNGAIDNDEVKNEKYSSAIRVDGGIAEYIKKATIIEFEKAGLNVSDSANIEVRAEILELETSDLLFSVKWILKVNYSLYDLDTGKVLINKLYETTSSSGALVSNVNVQISSIVSDTIEKFMSDIVDRQIFR